MNARSRSKIYNTVKKKKKTPKIWNRVDCQHSEKISQTHKRLKECFLIGQNRTKGAHFWGGSLFQATYNIKTEKQTTQLVSTSNWRKISWTNQLFFSVFIMYVAWKRGLSRKCACFVLFRPIKKHYFNLLSVLGHITQWPGPETISICFARFCVKCPFLHPWCFFFFLLLLSPGVWNSSASFCVRFALAALILGSVPATPTAARWKTTTVGWWEEFLQYVSMQTDWWLQVYMDELRVIDAPGACELCWKWVAKLLPPIGIPPPSQHPSLPDIGGGGRVY